MQMWAVEKGPCARSLMSPPDCRIQGLPLGLVLAKDIAEQEAVT